MPRTTSWWLNWWLKGLNPADWFIQVSNWVLESFDLNLKALNQRACFGSALEDQYFRLQIVCTNFQSMAIPYWDTPSRVRCQLPLTAGVVTFSADVSRLKIKRPLNTSLPHHILALHTANHRLLITTSHHVPDITTDYSLQLCNTVK